MDLFGQQAFMKHQVTPSLCQVLQKYSHYLQGTNSSVLGAGKKKQKQKTVFTVSFKTLPCVLGGWGRLWRRENMDESSSFRDSELLEGVGYEGKVTYLGS